MKTPMKRIAIPLLLTMLACATPRTPPTPAVVEAPPPPPTPAPPPDLVDHAGDSIITAIAVPANEPDGGVEYQNRWIYHQYGRFRRTGGGTGTAEGRRYNVVNIELPDGRKKIVYFDITELWQKSLQSQ